MRQYIMPFGKYRDRPLSEVPLGYQRWLLDQPTVGGYLRAYCRYYLYRVPPKVFDARRSEAECEREGEHYSGKCSGPTDSQEG